MYSHATPSFVHRKFWQLIFLEQFHSVLFSFEAITRLDDWDRGRFIFFEGWLSFLQPFDPNEIIAPDEGNDLAEIKFKISLDN